MDGTDKHSQKIEELREELHKAINMGKNQQILKISRQLDKELIKYIRKSTSR